MQKLGSVHFGDAPVVRCEGLAEGWARRLADGQPVHAAQVTRWHGPFYCAECHQEVILRRGAERAGHFAHERPRQGAVAGEEGALHRLCKQDIVAGLRSAHPEGHWELERTIPANAGRGIPELRPDISGRVNGWPVAIEAQASRLDLAEIVQRTRSYAQRKVHVLWVIACKEPPPGAAMAPRLHERFLHSLYFGRTYYWWPGMGATVLPIHFGRYDASYRSLRVPVCSAPLHIGRDFAPRQRPQFVPEDARKAVPACLLWLDTLPAWW